MSDFGRSTGKNDEHRDKKRNQGTNFSSIKNCLLSFTSVSFIEKRNRKVGMEMPREIEAITAVTYLHLMETSRGGTS